MEIIIQLPRDVNKLCRTCMNFTEDEKVSLENYIVYNNNLTELSTMLHNLTSLKIFPNDGLPETLCTQCVEQLKMAYAFKNQCTNTATNLKELIAASEPNSDEKSDKAESNNQQLMSDNCDPPQETQEAIFKCEDCQEFFTAYYDLSMHKIKHNMNMSLIDRYIANLSEDLKKTNKNNICSSTDNEIFIKERKSYIHLAQPLKLGTNTDFKNNSNQNQDLLVSADDVQRLIKPKGASKILNKPVSIRCKICIQEFKSRKELISHLCTPLYQVTTSSAKNKSITKCSLCEKEFPDSSSLSLHFLKHTLASENITNKNVESEYFFCEICGQTFDSGFLLHSHYNEKHEGKPIWTCPKCSQVFETERELLKHDKEHIEEIKVDVEDDKFSCVLCYQIFSSKEALLVHSRAHLMKKYSCKKCSASFCTQYAYFAHLSSHPGYQYTCSTCGKHLSTKSALKSHIVGVHSVELRHTCATCGKSFATHGRLKTHSLIHTSHKKYVCSYCGYSAHKVGDLQIHTRTHTSERPYKCTFSKCTMSFKTSSHLCDHVRRHLQIRKFQCSICSMGFTTNHGLKIHQMQHTGEKPHSCIVCNQKFRRKYHVKVHMKQHNPSYS